MSAITQPGETGTAQSAIPDSPESTPGESGMRSVPVSPEQPAITTAIADTRTKFTAEMDDDFNTAGALAALFELIRQGNTFIDAHPEPKASDLAALQAAAAVITELLGVLGVTVAAAAAHSDLEAEGLLAQRTEARGAKDWARADAIRDRLDALGFEVEDTAQGPRLVKK
jgi:cysteinyl-tRNA synthetase